MFNNRGSTVCEGVFFSLCEIKSRERNSITHIDPLMMGALEKDTIPRFRMLVNNMQQQKVNKDNNLLNLLCALSCVFRSADCSAIVFLHVNFNVDFCLISNFKLRVQTGAPGGITEPCPPK